MTIQIIRRASLGFAAGTIRTLAPATEAALVLDGEAIYVTIPNPASDNLPVLLDPTSGQIVNSDGSAIPIQAAIAGLVSTPGNAEDLAAFIAQDNLAIRYVVRDYVAPGYIY